MAINIKVKDPDNCFYYVDEVDRRVNLHLKQTPGNSPVIFSVDSADDHYNDPKRRSFRINDRNIYIQTVYPGSTSGCIYSYIIEKDPAGREVDRYPVSSRDNISGKYRIEFYISSDSGV